MRILKQKAVLKVSYAEQMFICCNIAPGQRKKDLVYYNKYTYKQKSPASAGLPKFS